MDVTKLFELPLPIINKDESKIFIETSKSYEGTLTIKNDGGGTLEGRITSNSYFLVFEPEYFTGNNSNINYTVDLSVINVNDKIHTNAVIISNGGEHTIEFIIKIVPHVINTIEGHKITSIKDFLQYSKKHPVSSRKLFVNHEFMMWLYNLEYEHMDLYEHFRADPNKERGLNNFFIFNKLKRNIYLSLLGEDINIKINPYINKIYTGIISVKRSGQGFIDEKICVKNKSSWIKLEKQTILSSDFKINDTIGIAYTIDKSSIKKKVERDSLFLENGKGCINITVTTINFLDVSLERKFIDLIDSGNLLIYNNSGENIIIELITKDDFVKFDGTMFKVNKHAKIPFNIKLSAIQLAQKNIKKKPVFDTEIYVKSFFNGETYFKTLKLTVGNFK